MQTVIALPHCSASLLHFITLPHSASKKEFDRYIYNYTRDFAFCALIGRTKQDEIEFN